MEFTAGYPGQYMIHAHQSEFTAKGWMGYLNVTAAPSTPIPLSKTAKI